MTPQEYVDLARDAEYYVDMLEDKHHRYFGCTFTQAGQSELTAVLKAFIELVKRDFPESV